MLHPYFLTADFARSTTEALCFVPDFRIGNRSLIDPDDEESYFGVSKDLIGPEHDAEMYRRILDAILRIRDENPACRFVFWSLGGSELRNRTRGHYTEAGRYRHPVWNLDEVEKVVGDQVISMLPILDHELGSMLHIDTSSHPSYIGLELFRRMTDRPDVSVQDHLDGIREVMWRPVLMLPRGFVLTGDSFWLKALREYVTKGLVALAPGTEIRSARDLLDNSREPGVNGVFFISGQQSAVGPKAEGLIAHTADVVTRLAQKGYNSRIFVWESRVAPILNPARRHPPAHPRSHRALDRAFQSAAGAGRVITEGPGVPNFVRPSDVEVSHPKGMMPTVHGLMNVVKLLGGNNRWEPL